MYQSEIGQNTSNYFQPCFSHILSSNKDGRTKYSDTYLSMNKMKINKEHVVYNFTVEEHHTYIADGFRVHNQSSLSVYDPEKYGTLTGFNPDKDFWTSVSDDGQGHWKVTRSEFDTNSKTKTVTTEYIYTDSNGQVRLIQEQQVRKREGGSEEILSTDLKYTHLAGDKYGPSLAKASTPFILDALGLDTFTEKLVGGTLVQALTQQIYESIGNTIEYSLLDASENLGVLGVFETASLQVFDDFFEDTAGIAVDTAVSLVNDIIAAEIFEAIGLDGDVADILNTVVSSGLDQLTLYGLDHVLEEAGYWTDLINSDSYSLIENFSTSLPVFLTTIVLKEILAIPEGLNPDTLEGNLTFALSNAALTSFLFPSAATLSGASTFGAAFAAVAPPVAVAFVVATILAKGIDLIFDEDPRAYSKIQFDPISGIFDIDDLYEKDGGNRAEAEVLGLRLLSFINQTTLNLQSKSNNFQEIDPIRIGHFEDKWVNGDGKKYKRGFDKNKIEDVTLNAYLDFIKDIRVEDGDLKVARALGIGEIEQRIDGMSNEEAYSYLYMQMRIAQDYQYYLENKLEVNNIINVAPQGTALAEAWITTLSLANASKLDDPYTATGDALDNLFFTADGADNINGAEGDDEIHTYGGVDTITGGAGNDIIDAGAGADYIDGGSGADTISFASSSTSIKMSLVTGGQAGDAVGDTYISIENIRGSGFSDQLSGNNSANTIEGGDGSDLIFGGAGNDTLSGGNGNDILVGGSGGDILKGGAGIDIVSYRDASSSVNISLQNDLNNSADAVGDVYDSIEGVEGSSFNDVLEGTNDSDVINGWKGDDLIYGLRGDDIYRFSKNHGNDIIYDTLGFDRIEFSEGITLSDLRGTVEDVDGDGELDFKISYTDAAGSVTIGDIDGPFHYVNEHYHIDEFLFSDGTIITWHELISATAYTSTVENDVMLGTRADDIYTIQPGAGDDLIYDRNGFDEVKFINGLLPTDLLVTLIDENSDGHLDLNINFANYSGSLTISNIFGYGIYPDGRFTINTFSFDNGTQFLWDDFLRIYDLSNSSPLTYVAGSAADDSLIGTAADEFFAPGLGDDVLTGGAGADTYQIGKDTGVNAIYESGISTQDRVVFGPGIILSEILAEQLDEDGNGELDLKLSFGVGSDSLIIHDFAVSDSSGENSIIEIFQFSDGSTYTASELISIGAKTTGTSGDDVIHGSDGEDHIFAGPGNDSLVGQPSGTYPVGQPLPPGISDNDIYFYNIGDGNDIVYDSAGNDTISFGSGISLADLIVSIEDVNSDGFLDLEIRFSNAPGSISVNATHWNDYRAEYRLIEWFAFSDGTIINFTDLLTEKANPGTSANDIIHGSYFDDVYLSSMNQGDDIIYERWNTLGLHDGFDQIIFSGEINLDNILVTTEDVNNDGYIDTKINFINRSDPDVDHGSISISATHWDSYQARYRFVESFSFADGSQLSFHELLDATANRGTPSDDITYGLSSGTEFFASQGNDRMFGNRSDDIYHFERYLGDDTILDAGGSDKVIFGSGIRLSDLKIRQRDNNDSPADMIISFKNSTNSLTILSQYSSGRIETFEFYDGLSISTNEFGLATNSNDVVSGDQNDNIIFAYGGDDIINGSVGSDILNGGEGIDTVIYTDLQTPITVDLDAGVSYFGNNKHDQLSSIENAIGTEFSDVLIGSYIANRLEGLAGNDKLEGLNGDDTILGGDGNDEITGGYGNDRLEGGLGDDTYKIALSEGDDTLIEVGGSDVIEFAEGIQITDLLVTTEDVTGDGIIDLKIALTKSAPSQDGQEAPLSSLTITNTHNPDAGSSENIVETIKFSDGSQLSWNEFLSQTVYSGTSGDDLIQGTYFDDTYNVTFGQGDDIIHDEWGANELKFTAGVTLSGIVSRLLDVDLDGVLDLQISGLTQDGSTTVLGWINGGAEPSPEYPISQFTFSDGTSLDQTAFLSATRANYASISSTSPAAEPSAAGGFTISLERAASVDTLVSYLISGSAEAGSDYEALVGTAVIPAGSLYVSVDIIPIDDAVEEPDETIIVSLSALTGDPDLALSPDQSSSVIMISSEDFVNDYFEGTAGGDVFYVAANEGDDQIFENAHDYTTSDRDRIVFDAGIALADVITTSEDVDGDGVYDLKISFAGQSGSVSVLQWSHDNGNLADNHQIYYFEFADGTTLNRLDFVAQTMGTDGDDYFRGSGLDDVFTVYSGQGDDRIEGYSRGDQDKIVFADGITLADVITTSEDVDGDGTYDLKISFANDNGSVSILGWSDNNSTYAASYQIETFEFADGTTLNRLDFVAQTMGTDGDDYFRGSGLDDVFTVYSGQGDDRIEGYSRGDQDKIIFADGITLADVITTSEDVDGDGTYDLKISFANDSGSVSILGWSDNNSTYAASYQIETFEFADGTTLNRLDFVAQTMGTDGDDYFRGSGLDDVFTVYSGQGDDRIEGYSRGDQDKIIFADGITLADVITTSEDVDGDGTYDLKISFANDSGSLSILGWSDNYSIYAASYQIETFEFADSTTLNRLDFVAQTMGTAGDDYFRGSGLDDVFTVYSGQGDDRIEEYNRGDQDKIIFADGITLADVITTSEDVDGDGTYDLKISFANDSGSVSILGWSDNYSIYAASYQIETFEFADGTTLNRLDFVAQTMGTAGDDYFRGSGLDDVFTVYSGQGDDRIEEYNRGDQDKIIFADGITLADVITTSEDVDGDGTYDLKISFANDSGSVSILGWSDNYSIYAASYQIETFEFADGTTLNRLDFVAQTMGTAGDDYFRGSGLDDVFTVYSGQGDDRIEGLTSSDQDKIVFAEGITLADVITTSEDVDGNGKYDLKISFANDSGSVSILGWSDNNSSQAAARQIETFEFADGTTLNRLDFVAQTMGTTGDDYFRGSGLDDVFTIHSGDGDDRIEGFTSSDQDKIVFAEGITLADVVTTSEDVDGNGKYDLKISFANDSGSVSILGWSDNNSSQAAARQIETFEFADGTTLNRLDFVAQTMGTTGDDYFRGSGLDDVFTVHSGQGDDRIEGYSRGDQDKIVFADGITLADVITTSEDVDGDGTYDLKISFANDSGSVSILGWSDNNSTNAASYQIETFEFADGTTLNRLDFVAQTMGTDGEDYLRGSGVTDHLAGGAGDDSFYGAGGADRFIFTSGDGADVIQDFQNGSDTIELQGGITFTDLTITSDQGDTLIEYGQSDSIRLNGTDVSLIDEGDFVFS